MWRGSRFMDDETKYEAAPAEKRPTGIWATARLRTRLGSRFRARLAVNIIVFSCHSFEMLLKGKTSPEFESTQQTTWKSSTQTRMWELACYLLTSTSHERSVWRQMRGVAENWDIFESPAEARMETSRFSREDHTQPLLHTKNTPV